MATSSSSSNDLNVSDKKKRNEFSTKTKEIARKNEMISKTEIGEKRPSSGSRDMEPSPKKAATKIGPDKTKNETYFSAKPQPIKMNLTTQNLKSKEPLPVVQKKNSKVASVFNVDESDEEDEMPAEARMKMKNIGRNTPTAAGPNSFGKGNLGFCDRQRVFERQMKEDMDKLATGNS